MSEAGRRVIAYYRKFSTLINAFLVILMAYFLAVILWDSLAGTISSKVRVPAIKFRQEKFSSSGVARRRERVSLENYRVVLDRNIFGVKINEEQEKTQEVIKQTPLKLKLLGVIVSTVPGQSMAIIRDENKGKTDIYFLHDKIQNAEIVEIESDKVILKRGGKKEVLPLYEKMAESGGNQRTPEAPVRVIPSEVRGPSLPAGGPELDIRRVGENTYEVDKEDFDRITNNLGSILTQARVVPYFRNGKIIGYKIFNIRPDGVFAKIGLRNGDIIKRVNGETLESPEKALQLFQFLKTEDTFVIDLQRNGRDMTLTYRLR